MSSRTRTLSRWALRGCAALVAASCAQAFAQVPGGSGASARDLASRGRAAYDRGDLAAGCPLLAEAYRLDGQLLGAGFALGECLEKEGKLATAHRTFLDVATKAEARKEARAQEAKARAAALAPRLSRVKLDVSDKASARNDLVIELDGQAWPRASWAAPEPVDGGTHEVTARADGIAPWSTKVEVAAEGATLDVVVPFDREASAPAPTPPQSAPAPAQTSAFPWKSAGLVTGAAGVGLLGAGIVVGFVAKGDYEAVEADCDASGACSPAAAATRDDARGLAGVGTALFIGGAVVAAAGVAVFVFVPDDDATTAALRVAPGAVELTGTF